MLFFALSRIRAEKKHGYGAYFDFWLDSDQYNITEHPKHYS